MSDTEPITNIPATVHVVRLRTALQAARAETAVPAPDDTSAQEAARRRKRQIARAIDEAADPLITQFMPPLTRACAGYARQAGAQSGIEADDLVQDAWAAALDYLCDTQTGGRIQNDVHFERLLKKCAFHLFLNRRRRKDAQVHLDAPFEEGRETLGQRLRDPLPLPDELLLAPQSAWSDWLYVLFTGNPNEFRAACQTPPRRRSVVYQAFVLVGFAGFLRVLQHETGARGEFGQSILRDLSLRLRIPPPFWDIAERATRAAPPMGDDYDKTRDAGVCDEIKQSVCDEIGVPVMSQSFFYVLRNEAHKLAMGDKQTNST